MYSSFSDELVCNTTDEEQDDLPYDGDVGVSSEHNHNSDYLNDCPPTKAMPGILNSVCSEDNRNIKACYETHPQAEEFSKHRRGGIGTAGSSAAKLGNEATFKKGLLAGSSSKPANRDHLTHSKIPNVLLRHFSKELTHTCQLIECETIPETSFSESIDDIVTKPEPSQRVKSPLTPEHCATSLEDSNSEKHKEVNVGDKNQNSVSENRCASKKPNSSTAQCGFRQEKSELIGKNEDTRIFQHMQVKSAPFNTTVSFHELQYSQGQAHCSLLDFSEVAPEVPKPSGRINSVPTTERTKPFPILPSKPLTAINFLENKNYSNSAEAENKEMSIPELLQQLEMLTHHADTQNHSGHLGWNPKNLPQPDFPDASTTIYSGGTKTSSEVFTLHAPTPVHSTHGLSKASLQCRTATASPAAGTLQAQCLDPSNLLPELTLGEKMSQILKDQTDQLTKEVENFSQHMTQDTFLSQDNYLVLNQLKRYLDVLERNYLTAREHHSQLQNYKDQSINAGEFDPERKVEGEIFRLGTLLEDLQEQTDDSNCDLSSLPASYESAHSSYSHCESSADSSIADPLERRGIETAFLHKNDAEENYPSADVISQTNQFALECEKCNLGLHLLQKRAGSTDRRDTQPLGKGGLLANKHSDITMVQQRSLSPEEKYAAGGLASHSLGALSEKLNADEESMKGNVNIQERKTGTCSHFVQRKPTDLSDTNLSSDSEDISACDSYGDSQSKELVNLKNESYKRFNTKLNGERKGLRCPRGSRDQCKFRNYKESDESCALCRNKRSGSSSCSLKGIFTQKTQKNKTSCDLLNRLSGRQNLEASKTCYSSKYDEIIPSRQYLPTKESVQRRSAINTRNRNASDSNTKILSSTLDHAIQTANSLKKATEQMVRAVSEDLAKVKRKQL
ncbi:protein AKNAD1 [Pogoniulus pusillus]|uniref:protein AKNAD1 n=1 Tax=Pogoniulus pusillus TaxID=488313 RepID=UPI0030B976C1